MGKTTITLNEVGQGSAMNWSICTRASRDVRVTMTDRAGNVYFDYRKKEMPRYYDYYPLGEGAAECRADGLSICIGNDETSPTPVAHKSSVALHDQKGSIIGHNYTINVEDWTDDDCNDICINLTVWNHAKNIPHRTRLMVIVNKNWETEPVLSALTNPKLRPAGLPFPTLVNTPKDGDNKMTAPRAKFYLSDQEGRYVEAAVWCIEDLMSAQANSSSSEEKYRVLPPLIKEYNPDLVISVSTANYPIPESNPGCSTNGCVFIGGTFFLHDGHPGNPESNLQSEYVGKLLRPNVNPAVFGLVRPETFATTQQKFVTPPNAPATGGFVCKAAPNYSAVSSINVTDYTEYTRVDEEALRHFEQVAPPEYQLQSIETTHGVVKISTDKPILFVSPVTDRLGHFDDDVTDTQNYVCAFNGGLALGQLLCELTKYVKGGGVI